MFIPRYFCLILCFFTAVFSCTPKKIIPPIQQSQNDPQTLRYERFLDRSRDLISDRRHQKALDVLFQADEIAPFRPEWAYERARALFAMDRFEESASACRQALEIDPEFYEAKGLGWAAQIEAAGGVDEIKQRVRQEIEALPKLSGTNAAFS